MSAVLLSAVLFYADAAQLDCPLDRLTGEERTALHRSIVEQGPQDDPPRVALRRSAAACGARYRWSNEALRNAANYNFIVATIDDTSGFLVARGVDVAQIERLLIADRTVMDAVPASPAQSQALDDWARRNLPLLVRLLGTGQAGEQNFTVLGSYMAARAMIDNVRAGFIAN
jgi:hypothetical protein